MEPTTTTMEQDVEVTTLFPTLGEMGIPNDNDNNDDSDNGISDTERCTNIYENETLYRYYDYNSNDNYLVWIYDNILHLNNYLTDDYSYASYRIESQINLNRTFTFMCYFSMSYTDISDQLYSPEYILFTVKSSNNVIFECKIIDHDLYLDQLKLRIGNESENIDFDLPNFNYDEPQHLVLVFNNLATNGDVDAASLLIEVKFNGEYLDTLDQLSPISRIL